MPRVPLPQPTGHYGIGTLTCHWVDADRPEAFTDGNYVQVPGVFHAYSLAFLGRHLKGRPAALLDGPAQQYPEVLVETRRP